MKIKLLLTLLFSACFFGADAQWQAVYIGVNGLTCSQCSRTVELQIRKLDFVADVQMNLEHTEGKILLAKDKKVDMERIAQAVFDAGFSVRYLQADINVDGSFKEAGGCYLYQGDAYVFAEQLKEPLKGLVKLTFIGKKFLPRNELKKYTAYPKDKCKGVKGKVYHVAL